MDDDQELNSLLGSPEGDEDNEIILSPAALIKVIEEAWLNEKFAPEILPNKIEFVELLLGQLKVMDENLKGTNDRDIKKSIHQLEVDRLRFLVSSYLRTRLEKVEIYVEHILTQENERLENGEETYLTDSELRFANSFKDGIVKHFSSFMINDPALKWKNQLVQPNVHQFVFSKSKTDIESIMIDESTEDDTVYVNKDSQIFISYNSISNLVKNGGIQLI